MGIQPTPGHPQNQGFPEGLLTTNNYIYEGESDPSTFWGVNFGVAGCIHKLKQNHACFGGMPLFWASAVSKHFLYRIGRIKHVKL